MNARGKATLTLAHSADADDVFMWWPITGKIDPANPGRVVEPPAIDTGRFSYRALPEDIQAVFPSVAGHRLAAGARAGALQARALLRAVALP